MLAARPARALMALLSAFAVAGAAQAGAAPRRTPSGQPVPRYVSLKFGEVNARAGPGDDYKLLWTYRTRGLPVQVIAETDDWRRICDPEGSVAWVHQRTVDNRRTVMRVEAQGLPLHRGPDERSPTVAVLDGRSLATFDACKKDWCQVTAGRARGWAPAAALWGTADKPQCRPGLPAPVAHIAR